MTDHSEGSILMRNYNIGSHMHKLKSLVATVKALPKGTPSQIFLGSPQNTKMNIDEKELALTKEYVNANNLDVYVHSQYIINLATKVDEDSWHINLLKKNLTYASSAGFKGVVVHVGKSTKQDINVALEIMRENILNVIESATELCPLLLETPAGQGTELLTDCDDFIEFVKNINDSRLKICLDTCHVFATGKDPNDYLKKIESHDQIDNLLLVHFNDSLTCCGSCKDRHAFIGTGYIGIEKLTQMADSCIKIGVHMINE